ncbi:MxcI protein [Stigmatella sp. ncwal1]|uniref:MxcI protein n=1 Tax=Stigmatella ashevillensis TaxID=2995309 RepID=A0ABT5D2V4_9BACT|nr:MxcI protein [Stigmatella ashevillena]MDC0707458.1 MxcI protein [Stigmatella ashevillena]
MNLSMTLRSVRWLAMVLALPLIAACGDDEDPTPTDPTDPVNPASQYAIVTQTTVDGASTSYIAVTSTLDRTEPLSLANAIEVKGRALVFGPPKKDYFFVSSGSTVVRYNLTTEGAPQKGETVSFQGQGVTDITEYQHQFRFVSETKAYFFDGSTSQVIIWNPTAMTVTGVLPFSDAKIDNTVMSFSSQPLEVANQVIIPLGWRPSTGTTLTKQAGVLVVNPANDSLKFVKKTFKENEGCGYVRDGVVGADGKIYLSTEAYGAASYRVHRDDPTMLKPCLLRFDPQTGAFDDNFFVDLTTLTNGVAAGSVLQGPGGKTYLRVFDDAAYGSPVTKDSVPRVLASAVAWKWWNIKLDTLTATPVDTLPAAMGSTFLFPANDRLLFTNFTSNSQTELRELTDESGKVATVTPGRTFSFLQVR